jgi:hypothetical protein
VAFACVSKAASDGHALVPEQPAAVVNAIVGWIRKLP